MKTMLQRVGWTLVFCFLLWSEPAAVAQSTDVLTYHNDNARTGQYLNEQLLTPDNVNFSQFGKLWFLATDGKVMAEPLYATGVSIPGKGTRNVVFIVTEHDSVYAFDAESTNVLWQVSMLGTGEQTVTNWAWCSFGPEIGITATPVIDRQLGPNGTIFVEAMSRSAAGAAFQRLHALDLATGADRVPPVDIGGAYPGYGDNSDGANVVFNPEMYIERACLLLLNGVVYTAWSAHCDTRPATSWIMGFDEHTLAQTSVLNLVPNGHGGSIWNAGAGPAADADGSIYVTLGDGDFDDSLDTNGFPTLGNYGSCLVKLSTTNNLLAVADYFGMHDILNENFLDLDLASGSPLVLPNLTDIQGNPRQLVVASGKDQNLYLADRANLGKYNPDNDLALYQELSNALPSGTWSMPAYFNGTLYFGPVRSPLLAFPFQDARLSTNSSRSSAVFGYPGATPSISANGTSNGIVWAAETVGIVIEDQTASHNAVLHAFAATNLANELYNSNQATNRDLFGKGNKFITPMIAGGRVYVASTTGVGVFGLYPVPGVAPAIQTNPVSRWVMAGQSPGLIVSATGTTPLDYQWLKDGFPVNGANNSAMTITNAQVSDSGYYRVVVTNLYGSVTSTAALLKIVTNTFELGMVAYFPFNGNANDESGNGHDGVVNGGALSTNRFGQLDSAYLLSGLGAPSYIEVTNTTVFDSDDFTLSLWFKAAAYPGSAGATGEAMMLISRGRNDFEVHLGCPPFEPRGIRFLPRLISPTVAQVFDVRSPVFVTNTWMHMVASYQKSGSLGRLYLNGRELTTTSYTGGDGPPDIRSLKLGTRYDGALGGGVPFKGAMDDVRVYNRALSAQEVMGLYDLEFPDSDHDGLSDWEEINIYHTDPNKKDTDGDGLTDYQEVFVYHTDPTKADSDDDGFNDYAEIYSGHDPLNTTNFPAANLSLFTAIELEFISKTGTVYQIQASPDLTTWTNFDGPILGDGNIWKKTYSIRGSPSLFYRVELAP